MTTLLILLFFTLGISFCCSLMEAVILSVPRAYVSILEKKGLRSGRLLHKLHSEIDRPLAAILTLNTIGNTIGPMVIANQMLKLWGDQYLALASGLLTFTVLIFSEILPKTLGAMNAKKLAPLAAYVITFMVYATYPFVLISRGISRLFTRIHRHRTTREEMIATAEISATEGVLHQKESRIIRNLLMLDSIQVSEIMTPKSVMHAFDINQTVGTVMDKYKPVRYSRIPLYEGNIDNIKGLLFRYRLMEAVGSDLFNMPIRDIVSPIHRLSHNTPVSAALDDFLKRREHLFLVVDSKGKTAGIVTLEDTIETLLGVEIVDELDTVADMRQYALEQWRLKKHAYLK